MKRLSDYKGADAIILMGDLMESFKEIFGNPEVQKLKKGTPVFTILGTVLKSDPSTIIRMAAKVRDVATEEIETSWTVSEFFDLFGELYNSMEIRELFMSRSQASRTPPASTGSAMENIEDGKN
jgi:hypothetical protein